MRAPKLWVTISGIGSSDESAREPRCFLLAHVSGRANFHPPRQSGTCSRANAKWAEVATQSRLEERTRLYIERLSGRAQNVIHDLRHFSRVLVSGAVALKDRSARGGPRGSFLAAFSALPAARVLSARTPAPEHAWVCIHPLRLPGRGHRLSLQHHLESIRLFKESHLSAIDSRSSFHLPGSISKSCPRNIPPPASQECFWPFTPC